MEVEWNKNRYIITWMLHHIFMYSDKMMLAAGWNNDIYTQHLYPTSPLLVDDQQMKSIFARWIDAKSSPVNISTYILYLLK